MPSFDSDGVEIVYETFGVGAPVILCHGFAAHRRQAWMANDWQGTLMKAGREAVMFDHRGHGESEKLYKVEDYSIPLMAGDVLRLMDKLDIAKAPVISHSMGAHITLYLAMNHGDRLETAVLIGIGENMLESNRDPNIMAEALTSTEPWNIEDEAAASFRAFVDSTRSDHDALAACTQGIRHPLDRDALARIDVPTLVVGAAQDEFSGSVEPLADAIAGAKHATIPYTSHHSVLAEASTKDLVFEFLGLPAPEHYEHSW
jgi:pimeloyl-ACP methyl ester carboxylesterase